MSTYLTQNRKLTKNNNSTITSQHQILNFYQTP